MVWWPILVLHMNLFKEKAFFSEGLSFPLVCFDVAVECIIVTLNMFSQWSLGLGFVLTHTTLVCS